MRDIVEIENIEELRRREGIDDAELHKDIRELRVGDHIRLTLMTGGNPFRSETVLVRITSITRTVYRGKLAKDPTALGASSLRAGSLVTFSRDHIHSIWKAQSGRRA
jgi:hypothetical protein